MDRHELMVGDWIETLNQNKEVCRVQVNEIQEKQVSFYHKNHYYLGASYENVKPIALTKEMLEKNGFEFFDSSYFNDIVSITFFSTGIYFNCHVYKGEVCDVIERHINYVHELQHLLCLCGLKAMANNFKIE